MNCPYCGDEMKKGEVQTGSAVNRMLRSGDSVLWIPEEDCAKIIPKKTINLATVAEGYYCEQCVKVVAIFDERGAGFFQ